MMKIIGRMPKAFADNYTTENAIELRKNNCMICDSMCGIFQCTRTEPGHKIHEAMGLDPEISVARWDDEK